jgi:hypothetical protein
MGPAARLRQALSAWSMRTPLQLVQREVVPIHGKKNEQPPGFAPSVPHYLLESHSTCTAYVADGREVSSRQAIVFAESIPLPHSSRRYLAFFGRASDARNSSGTLCTLDNRKEWARCCACPCWHAFSRSQWCLHSLAFRVFIYGLESSLHQPALKLHVRRPLSTASGSAPLKQIRQPHFLVIALNCGRALAPDRVQ